MARLRGRSWPAEMTMRLALDEAVRRWGPEARAVVGPFEPSCRVGVYVWDERDPYRVIPKGWDPARYGEGASWEAAFSDADRRAREVSRT